ncbi:LOW QUALITY PROTEIN: probable ribosome-binding factor A, chloroplastic [Primulina eburnea]|uniref:LOW QUALITY PROTEIN: probable ribosome-binding factor A, chloroplastic n=1 Tax=Primulina eburnea TaxID=1245227 RepID=UPI003C6BE4EA
MTHLQIHRSPVAPPCSIANPSPWFCHISSFSLLKTSPRGICTTTGGGGGGVGVRTIRCMAHPRRVRMVAKQIMRELSDMLLTDKVLQSAILPEVALGADRYLSSLTTISDVEISSDLQVVKVYVSVFGDERGKEVSLAGLKSKAKYVRSELGKRMKLRLTPEIRFVEDESIERGSRVLEILDRIKDENEKKAIEGEADDFEELSDRGNNDVEWEGDDIDDDGVIYVK